MLGKTALVVGASGLVGQQLVKALLQDDTFTTVKLLVRRPYTVNHPKTEVQLVDFDSLDDITQKTGKGDVIFCCVGTTNKKVKGDKTAYRNIDHNIPFNVAWAGLKNGYEKYLLVSAVGANAGSKNFYLQLKGEAEDDISNLHLHSLQIFRPSFLLGNRKEFRLGELFAKILAKPLSIFLGGSLRKYKPVRDITLAKAMIAASKKDCEGKCIYHYDDIINLVSQTTAI